VLLGVQAPPITLGCTIAKKLASDPVLVAVAGADPIFMVTEAPMPSMVASPDANCPSVESMVVPDPIPPWFPGMTVPPPLAVRLLILIFVIPSAFGFEPISLVIATSEGDNADLEMAVSPPDADKLALVPKLVELPTLREVLLPLVTDRFSVFPDAGAVTLTPAPVGAIVD